MRKTFRKRNKLNFSLFFSALILLTMPIAIYSLLSSQNFDMRHLAYDEEKNVCTINIPYVSTKTLGIGRNYQVHIHSDIQGEKIEQISVVDSKNNQLFSKNYSAPTHEISETFIFTPSELGNEEIFGEIQTDSRTYPCKMDAGEDVIYVIEKNNPPRIVTDPYFSASPPSSSLTTEESYEYVLEVIDPDQDPIQYHYSFTPRAHWLNKTVVESGANGNLKIRFSGTPERKGSYLASIFVHDGHNTHISGQSWVINIGDESDDTPLREEPKLPDIDSDIENEIFLPEPQITSITPSENSFITNPQRTISVNLIASSGANIDKEDITFKLNENDLTKQADLVRISQSEVLLRYKPETNLETGEHKVYVYLQDSNNLETDKSWTFTLEQDSADATFLGIPVTTLIIFVVGIFLVLFALSIPWIIYIAWKKDQPEDYKEIPIMKP